MLFGACTTGSKVLVADTRTRGGRVRRFGVQSASAAAFSSSGKKECVPFLVGVSGGEATAVESLRLRRLRSDMAEKTRQSD